ncbi:hypothetical protein Tco_0768508 [Tanacetum coccineum]
MYTADVCCSKKGLEDKILVPKPPRNCARCGTPVDGPYCQGCALLRKKFKEDLFTYCVENEFFKDLQDTSESSDDNYSTDVNVSSRAIVGNQDPSYTKDREEEKRIAGRTRCWTILPTGEDIDYVDALPPDVEIVSLEVVEIVDPEVGRNNDDILLTNKDDILLSPSFPNFSGGGYTFDNLYSASENFPFNAIEEIVVAVHYSSSLLFPIFKAFYVDNDHFKEKSSGSTTTHVDFSQYDSFILDLSNDQFPPADRSDPYHEEFADELAHIMSLPNLECFKFKWMSISSLFAYVVWIFLAFLTYLVEDTILDPGISMYHSFMPDVSHRNGTFMKFNVYPNRLNGRTIFKKKAPKNDQPARDGKVQSRDDSDVMFIEIIKKNDDSHEEEPKVDENAEAGELEVEYFDIFSTRSELTYHKYLMSDPIPSIFLRTPSSEKDVHQTSKYHATLDMCMWKKPT